jgi:CubicO group peptidase (beta-lactamase class C family)
MKKKTIFFIFLLTFILAGNNLFPGTKEAKFDALFEQCKTNQQFNGNVLVAEKGKIIYHRAYGIAAHDPVKPLKIDSQFRLGSVTKQFTAMAIMILKEKGKLDYKDDIRKYLPELPYKDITIHHLLTHTSGMPNYLTLFAKHWDVDKKNPAEKKLADNDDVIKLLAKYHPAVLFKPGEKWRYSNTAYVLLAVIVSRVAKEPFEKFLHHNIFKPLDMTRSLVYSAIRDDRMKDRVYGYRLFLESSGYQPNDFNYLNGVAGDGAVYSTTSDLFKWDRALYTEKLVSKSTLELAFTPVTLNDGSTHDYGYGWGIAKSLTGKKRVRHGGGWVGFVTYITRDIEENNTIILLTNHSSRYIGAIRKAADNILHDKPYTLPKIPISRVIGKTILEKDIQSAIRQYHRLKKSSPDKYDFREQELNRLGYGLIQLKKPAEAIEIFKLNVKLFPKSWNPYDSLGEVYMLNGNVKLSITNYKKSLELNPNNNNAVEMLKQLTKK